MTRSSSVSSIPYTGTGGLATYSYPFFTQLQTDVQIVKEIIATAVTSTLVLGVDFTVLASGLANPNGGSITLIAGNLPSTEKIVISRVVPLTQETDIRNQAAYFPETQEDQFDKHNDVDQQQQAELSLSLKMSNAVDPSAFDTEITGARTAGLVPAINGDEDGIVWTTFADGSNIALPATLALMVQKPAGTFIGRTLAATGNITIDNGDGQAGNPTVNSTAIDTAITDIIANVALSKVNRGTLACTSTTEVVIDSGFQFQGVATNTRFTFTSSRTFDISATPGGLGALDTGQSESTSTWYYPVALGDTTGAVTPHVIGVSKASYAAFTTARLVDDYAAYDDFKRLPGVFNSGGGDLQQYRYVEHEVFPDQPGSVGITSTSFVDIVLNELVSPVGRIAYCKFITTTSVAAIRFNGSPNSGLTITGVAGNDSSARVLLDSAQTFEGKSTNTTLTTHVVSYQDDLTDEDQ